MAQTTTHVNACNAVVMLDDAMGMPVDISGSSNQVSIALTAELGMLHTFSAPFPVRTSCGKDAEISMRGVYSTATGESADLLSEWFFATGHMTPRTLTISVPDDEIGSDRYTFEVLLERLNVPIDGADANPILLEATLRPTGTFSRAAIAS